MGWIMLLAAVAPAAFMLHFVYARDRYEREPLGRVLVVFFLSTLAVIPAALFEALFLGAEKFGLLGIAISCWGVIALCEETVKYWALRLFAVNHSSFNEIYDGILYGVTASLGFATVENIMYVVFSGEQAVGVAIMRALLAVPAHALWGVMMGYYVGLAKFATDDRRKRPLVLTGLAMAIFWHGLYDFFAFSGEALPALGGLLMLGVAAVVVVNWMIGVRYINRAQALSWFKRPSPMVNPVAAVAVWHRFCERCGKPHPRGSEVCIYCGHKFGPV